VRTKHDTQETPPNNNRKPTPDYRTTRYTHPKIGQRTYSTREHLAYNKIYFTTFFKTINFTCTLNRREPKSLSKATKNCKTQKPKKKRNPTML